MKTKIKKIAFYLLAVALGGCVPSLHPLFTENEIVFDANLVGKWHQADSNNFWQFSSVAGKKYDVIYTDEKGIAKFEAMLGKVGSESFLDLYPKDMNIPGNDYYKAHLIGAHTFVKVEMHDNGLSLLAMNPEGVDKILKADPNAVKHENVNDRIVLTASTKELQGFVGKYSNDPNVYNQSPKDKFYEKVK
ncbi:MAG: hypothetical protein LLF92_05645 [Planctomycetaceae bacterium]|nr:hypothetical protein [Planctomycetaceae bacterium]